jgi:thioredoxin-like negative regulator of GroEL
MSGVIHIRNKKEYDEFKSKHRRAVVFYGAEWCEACTDMWDIYNRIAKRYQKYVALGYADIEECKLDFSAVPVFVSLRKGQQLNSMEGADRRGLKQLIKEVIQSK